MARRLQGLRLPYQPPLLHWALAFTVGAALSLTGANIWAVALAVAVVCAFAFSSGARIDAVTTRQRLHLTLILLSPVLLGAGYWRANETRLPADSLAAAELAGQTVRLTGVVAEEPQFRSTGIRLLLDAQTIAVGSDQSQCPMIACGFTSPIHRSIEFGDRIAIDAVLTPTSDFRGRIPAMAGKSTYCGQRIGSRRKPSSSLARLTSVGGIHWPPTLARRSMSASATRFRLRSRALPRGS